MLLEREDGQAVLAAGRPGLGRVLVWTLPARDPGTAHWAELGRLYGQAARAVMAPGGAFSFLPTTSVVQGPDGAGLRIAWPPGESRRRLRVRWRARRASATWAPSRRARAPRRGRSPSPRSARSAGCGWSSIRVRCCRRSPTSWEPPPVQPPRAGDATRLAAALGTADEALEGFVERLPTATTKTVEPHWHWLLWIALALLPFDVWLHRRSGVTP